MLEKYKSNSNESFNAKMTTKSSLCDTFISNSYFHSLTSPNHTIMIGPRGSGKTTLMRMLDVESLEIWDKEIAEEYRNSIDYSGVFIPTDRFWKTQFDLLSDKYKESPKVIKAIESTFIYHILECFTQVLSFRVNRVIQKRNNFQKIELSKTDELELVSYLAEMWKVEPKILSLRGLGIAVSLKKQTISRFLTNIPKQDVNSVIDIAIPIIEDEIIQIIGATVSITNNYIGESVWAFLFDELELAPKEFIQPLIDAMRGGPQNVLLKLALSPYHKGVSLTKSSLSGMSSQDLTFINLTSTKKEGLAFARELCTNIFLRNNLTNDIDSYFELPSKINTNIEFEELRNKDKSFAAYLTTKKIDINKYESLGTGEQSTIRKIQFNVHLRNYSLANNGQRKSRKRASDYYTGFENICSALEYNPRMLVGTMMLFSLQASKGKIKSHIQLDLLGNYLTSFNALLSTIALDSKGSNFNNIFKVIEVIAGCFSKEIHGATFKPDPKGKIKFENESNENYIEAIGLAMNAGALISENNDVGSFHDFDDIKKSKCRLSYLFAHKYGLLMNLQRDVDLAEILNNTKIDVINPVEQGKLFS